MISHVVVFWTDPARPAAADELIAGAWTHLASIPGVQLCHAGRMVPSPRPVVDKTYQVALNLTFTDHEALEGYQVHPRHLEYIERFLKPNCTKVLIYDFE